jgi:hypothetical protein|nr:MAG TPA: hypothetical protein [Caudoviricetes sp.]
MSEEKYLRPRIMEVSPKTVASVASDYMIDFPWGEDGVTERPYTNDREFLPVLLDCVGRVFSAQTRVGLKCAIGDVIGAIGVRLIRGTNAYDNSMSTVQQSALFLAGALSEPTPWGMTSTDIARTLSETMHMYADAYVQMVAGGVSGPAPTEPRTDKPLMDLASKSIYLLALLEDLYPTVWEDDLGASPLKDGDLTPRPGAGGPLEQVADRIFEAWKANQDG